MSSELSATARQAWAWPDSLDALVAAPGNHSLLFENDRVRVVQTRQRALFVHELTLGLFGNLPEVPADRLEGHSAAKLKILSFIDNSHPTAAEHFHNAVVGNCCSNHRLRS